MTRDDITAKSLPQLTSKQRDVLALVADNRTSKEIAARLDISESAVNQRIEMIRQRLGGLPRGELARLYRQEFAPQDVDSDDEEPTWQKIHLPHSGQSGKGGGAESISLPQSVGSHLVEPLSGDGSQLSALFFDGDDGWVDRDDRATMVVRHGAMFAIVTLALAIAVGVTYFVGPIG